MGRWRAIVVACVFGMLGHAGAQDAAVLSAEADAGVPANSGAPPEGAPAPTHEQSAERQTDEIPQNAASAPAPSHAVVRAQSPIPPGPALGPTDSGTKKTDTDVVGTYGAIAVVPASRVGVGLQTVPRNVQVVDRAALDEDSGLGLGSALNLRLGSVVINDVQNNPLQPDVQYRGYSASPLLGSAQGLVVYQNGVRTNDAFGDVLQWDLIPDFAVDEVQVMPGASPLYGLNALGGGIALRMKNGFTAPGARAEALTGSFGRYVATGEYGHTWSDWALYTGVSAFGEQGFRDESQSMRRQLYADLRQKNDRQEIALNATLVDTDLNGNGPSPIQLLSRRRAAIFTFPDNTQNQMLLVSADARSRLTERISVGGSAYFKHLGRDTMNGDEGELQACDSDATILCDEEGDALVSESGTEIAAPTTIYDAVFNRTRTASGSHGGGLHATFEQPIAHRPNQLMVGGTYDGSSTAFLQRVQLGYLTEERSVAPENLFVANDGFRTKLDVDTHHVGVFVSDTFSLVDRVALQLSGRFNWSDIEMDDRAGTALDGRHTFLRFNPAVGMTYTPISALTLFASYSESSRAPSAVELACADPAQPCRVPNAFVADPPLDQVVAQSVEFGVRGELGGSRAKRRLTWSLAGFGSRNFDDIIFVAGSTVGTGYFKNAGKTERVGIEAAATTRLDIVRLFASYALLRATFQSALTLPGEGNPEAREDDDGDVIDVQPGDRLPGLPTHSLKAGVVVTPVVKWDVGVSTLAQSSRPYRGDEASLLDHLTGYAIVNAHTSYWLLDSLQLFLRVENLLDHEYETFGVLAEPGDVVSGVSNPRFASPGAPLAVWAGLVVREL